MSRCSATLLATMLLCCTHACSAMEDDTGLVNQLQKLGIEGIRKPTLDGMGEEIEGDPSRS